MTLKFSPHFSVGRNILLQLPRINPNAKELTDYKNILPDLSEVQSHWSAGLLLGDSSISANSNLKSFRLKMQQSEANSSLLFATAEILRPFVLTGVSELKTRKQGNSYRELQTLSCPQFTPLAELFAESVDTIRPNSVIQKVIPSNIADFLSPVSVGAWFCSDGGRRDYGSNEGKAVQFHTQGFTKKDCETLVSALKSNYEWEVDLKLDYEDKYYIQIEASSFDSFKSIVSPYILDHFLERLPKPLHTNV